MDKSDLKQAILCLLEGFKAQNGYYEVDFRCGITDDGKAWI